MMDRVRSRTATTMLLLAMLAVMILTAALADPPDQSGVVERAPELSAWVFWDGDLIVFSGPPQDAATCLGLATQGFDYEGFLKPISTIVTRSPQIRKAQPGRRARTAKPSPDRSVPTLMDPTPS